MVALSDYRIQLFEYLKQRMNAIAPNLTVMVGELVGARLISHAGSLINLAKHPASTIQILGAEKALFRALKTKTDTPKYGLIYHASLIGQAGPKAKGKVSRVLAAKTALAVRYDAFNESEHTNPDLALESRAKVEARIRQLEGGQRVAAVSTPSAKAASSNGKTPVYDASAYKSLAPPAYNPASDMTLSGGDKDKKEKKDKKDKKDKKREREEDEGASEDEGEKKKKKKEKKDKKDKE